MDPGKISDEGKEIKLPGLISRKRILEPHIRLRTDLILRGVPRGQRRYSGLGRLRMGRKSERRI